MIVSALALTGILLAPTPGVEVLKVSIDKQCRLEKLKLTTVKQADRDILVWRIQNDCPTPRNVLICVRPTPPLKCSGDPETAVLDTTFKIGGAPSGKVRNYIACTVKWPATKEGYEIDLRVGSTSDILICSDILEDYELALEVVP